MSPIYPQTKTARHYLFEIDRESKTAYCSACGWTEIYVPKGITKENPKIFCITRYQELKDEAKEKSRLKLKRKPRHSLSEIDLCTMTATCSICGSTKIQKRTYNGLGYYSCATKIRLATRKYRRTHYTPRSTKPFAHVLSQIDEEAQTAVCSRCGPIQIYVWQGEKKMGRRCSNAPVRRIPQAEKARCEMNLNIINRYKVEHGCKRCGYNENLHLLCLYSGNPERKELKLENLLGVTSKELTDELKSCDVFCVNCCGFVNYDLFLKHLKATIDY